MYAKRLLAALVALVAVSLPSTATAADFGHDANTVIVKFRDGTSPLVQRVALAGAPVVGRINGLGSVVALTSDPVRAAARLNALPVVQYAEVNKTLRATAIPNDPRFGELYGLNNTGQGGGTADADIDAPEGWDAAGLGAFPATGGVKVGIVDTGIRATHEDIAGKVADCAQSRGLGGLFGGSIQVGSCTDDNSHGTHVAGTISGNANNGRGVAGVAFNSPLAICRALGGPLGSGSTSDVANCITWLSDRGAKVISMSLGGGDSTTLRSAVQYAWKNGSGALLVAAAGNDGNSTVNYPAGYAEVVSVAATDNRDQRASFSNANPDVEIAAPGVGILSSTHSSNTSYGFKDGTSMATPHVSGVAALIFGRTGGTAASVRTKLQTSVDDKGAAGRDPQFGFGRVNLVKAMS
jgi:thermitase